MSHFSRPGGTILRILFVFGIIFTSFISVSSRVSAQSTSAPVWVVRTLQTAEFGVGVAKGLTFSSAANTFLILDAAGNVTQVSMGEDHLATQHIPEVQNAPLNAAFDDHTGDLFTLDRGRGELVQKELDSPAPAKRFGVHALNLADPQGIAFDPATGQLFVLDSGKAQIVSMTPHETLGFDADEAVGSNKVQHISLRKFGKGPFRGMAFNPGNGHLYVTESNQKKLYELTPNGDLVSSFDLASVEIQTLSALTFAPSVDNTDDPGIYDLFVLDTGVVSTDGQIVELSLVAPAALPPGTTLLPTTLVHIIDTSNAVWNPSAPDPSGVDYWPLTGRLLISDSEVEEMTYWAGKNVFQSTLAGPPPPHPVATCSTTSFSNEPTGLAINPNNNHIFFSDDSGVNDKVYEVDLVDGVYCNGNDTVTTTNVASLYGANDAEDVAYGNNTLFIGDGVNAEVYRVPLGTNGVLGGGDDGPVTHFDTKAFGFDNVEGIGYNSDNGTLFIVSAVSNNRYLGETTTTGTLLNVYDLSSYSGLTHREDVTFAPSSQSPGVKNVYITDRGIDNDSDPRENDGQVWEISIGSGTPNEAPAVNAGADQTITLPDGANLDGTVSDDGLPNPPGALTTTWSKVNGPGTVTFEDANAVDTTAGFSVAGSYTLRLTASDSALSTSDNVIITVNSAGGNAAPVVNAGTDQTITLPSSASLDGTVSDDGLPNPPAAVTTLWSIVDGPGTVTFSNPSAVDTTASFSVDGVYTLRLTADDSALSTSDDVVVTVNPQSASDPIFADGFETADFDFVPPWSSSKTDAGDLSIQPAAAMAGSSTGMQAVIDDTVAIYVTSDHPNAEPRYRARFYFDPNSITMASGNAHFIFHGIMGTSTQVLRIEFRFSAGAYQIRGRLINDGTGWTNTSWFTITDAPHFIELDWRAATAAGASNGGLTLWIDGVEKANLTTVDNDTRRIDRVRLGAVAGIDTGTSGAYFFDAFESRRQTYIGP